jgi:hypothetical protein
LEDPAHNNPRVRFSLEGQGGNDELHGSNRADLLDGGTATNSMDAGDDGICERIVASGTTQPINNCRRPLTGCGLFRRGSSERVCVAHFPRVSGAPNRSVPLLTD